MASRAESITLPPCDDFHLHCRDGIFLDNLLMPVVIRFRRALIMPNLNPPITTTEAALAYRGRILAAIENATRSDSEPLIDKRCAADFSPLMCLYLTDATTPEEIKKAKASGHIYAVKWYPSGVTTHSQWGVTNIQKLYPVLRSMASMGLLLLVHGEANDPSVDLFDRERVFIEQIFAVVKDIPELKIVLEHISTREAVEFVRSSGSNVAGTITAHHLLYNRNALFTKGLSPHYYCLPVLKREEHRLALLNAATSGSPKFFAGTDSAPHPQASKECGSCAAGCYTSFGALELYAEAFEQAGALDKLRGFLCEHGARFYGIPLNSELTDRTITLIRRITKIPPVITMIGPQTTDIIPLRAGGALQWSLKSNL